ncbi:glutathione S-transferase [Paxillus ammoniavirescens]|nr:glutathione S-transferase [Paxillus ammoniavirescens]
MLTIYGFPISSCTKRVALILHEKAVPFRLVTVGPQDFKSPEHIKRQPFGQIPVLYDDDYHLYESRAIARYINAKYAGQGSPNLAPLADDHHGVGKFEMACSIEYSQFAPLVDRVMKEVIFQEMRQQPVDETVRASLKASLEAKLDVYNNILKKQEYLAGDNVSLADLFHLPECDLIVHKFDRNIIESREHVAKWWTNLSTRPSWLAVKDGVKGTTSS